MAQSNNEARRTNNGLLGRLANLQDRLNIIPGMNDQGRFSWGELGRDTFRTAGNMVFPGLGSLFGRGFGNGNGGGMRFNFDQRVSSPVRGVGSSIRRMFDNNPDTGFWNNPTAPWNNRPREVPEGHPDFVGPPAPGGGFGGGGGGGSSGFGPSSSGPSGGWNSPTGSWINTHGNNGNPQWGLGWLNNTNPSPSYSGPAPGSAGYGVIAPGGGGGGEGGGGDGGVSSGGNRGMTGGSNYGGQGWDPRTLHWILRGR
jgi:hypothetical protein